MCQFYKIYSDSEIATAVRSQLSWTHRRVIMRILAEQKATEQASQLSWTHHRVIMSRCKTQEERLFYLQLTATECYSTRELFDLSH